MWLLGRQIIDTCTVWFVFSYPQCRLGNALQVYTRTQVLSRKHLTLKNGANYKGMGSATERQTLIQSSFCLREGKSVVRASRFRVHRI